MPWKEDKLNREEYGKMLDLIMDNKSLFRKVSDESLVVAINSNYGSGKTTFLNMWSDHLKSNLNAPQDSLIININAWLSDDYENALIPFIHSINKSIQTVTNERVKEKFNDGIVDSFQKASLNSILRFGRRIIDHSLEKNLGFDTRVVESEWSNISDDFKSNGKSAYDSILETYDNHINSKEEFKIALSNIACEIPIIILIDELDRCRPTYAIETLEVVKHYFDVPNVVYVFAIDIEQLSHSVSTVYGQNMDSHGYLRKFFDVIVSLPKPTIDDYIKFKYYQIVSEANSSSTNLIDSIISVASEFNLSLREIDSLMPSIYLLLTKVDRDLNASNLKDQNSYTNIYTVFFFLFFLKYKKQSTYNLILNDVFKYSYSNMDERLPKSSLGGVSIMYELLSNGNNQTLNHLQQASNESGFKGDFSKFIRLKADRQALRSKSLGQFFHNYIESSLSLTAFLKND